MILFKRKLKDYFEKEKLSRRNFEKKNKTAEKKLNDCTTHCRKCKGA